MKRKFVYLIIALYFLSMGAIARIIEVPNAAAWGVLPFTGSSGTATGCAAIYADALFCWDGEDSGSNLNAIPTNGTPVTGTNFGSADIGAYGENGGQALKIAAAATEKFIYWTSRSEPDGIDAAQTICVRVHFSAAPDDYITLARMSNDTTGDPNDGGTEIMEIYTRNANSDIRGLYDPSTEAGSITTTTTDMAINSWTTVSYTWDTINATPDHNGSHNGVTYDTVDAITNGTEMSANPSIIMVGNTSSVSAQTITTIIDQFALFSGSEVDCTQYSGF